MRGTDTLLINLTGAQLPRLPPAQGRPEHAGRGAPVAPRLGIRVTVITPYSNGTGAIAFMTAVYGRAPVKQDGAWVWYGPSPAPT